MTLIHSPVKTIGNQTTMSIEKTGLNIIRYDATNSNQEGRNQPRHAHGKNITLSQRKFGVMVYANRNDFRNLYQTKQ